MKSITRRTFGGGIFAALAAGGLRPTSLQAQTPQDLIAREGALQLAPANYPQTQVWGYNGAVPGPTIRLPQGERMTRRFVNELPLPGTIHWHGIRIDNAMDGVPGLTQDVVAPGETFLYDFVLPDAGTYWYHPHNRSYEQMARGLCFGTKRALSTSKRSMAFRLRKRLIHCQKSAYGSFQRIT